MSEDQDNLLNLMSSSKKVYAECNHIYFYDDITVESAALLNSLLVTSIKNCKKTMIDFDMEDGIKIYLHINSYGGLVHNAMTVVDTIQNSPIPIVSIIEGAAASAATLISVVCNERRITKNSYMLIHQLSSGIWGSMLEIETEVKNLKKLMETLKTIYDENTLVDEKSLKKILKKDIYWDSSECLELGLVDEIVQQSNKRKSDDSTKKRSISTTETKNGKLKKN